MTLAPRAHAPAPGECWLPGGRLGPRQVTDAAPKLVEFAGYWQGEAGALGTNTFATPRYGSERQLRMSIPHREQKRLLMQYFQTQQCVLRPFDTRAEWIRLAPEYDFRAPPNDGRVWYDRFDWAVRSEEWLRLAAAYLDGVPARQPRVVC